MSYIIRETVFIQDYTSPMGYFRWDIEKYSGSIMECIENQMAAEFTNLTNFNDIKDEKYIEL